MQDTPKNLDQKRADEKMLVSEMIALYCHRQHKTPKGSLCSECRQLHDYALTPKLSPVCWMKLPAAS